MSEVSVLLTLPGGTAGSLGFWKSSSGTGFQEYRADGSASSPRRKIPRLDDDADITRSGNLKAKNGPVKVKVLTDDDAVPPPSARDAQIRTLRTCVHEVLDVDANTISSLRGATFESVYATCRALVTVEDEGAYIYDNIFQREVREALRKIGGKLGEFDKQVGEPMEWMEKLVKYCRWFEARISLLESLLTYLDQVYVVNHSSTRASLHDEAYRLFAETIFGNPGILDLLEWSLNTWLDTERTSHTPVQNRDTVVPALVAQLTTHGQLVAFEQLYIDATKAFYAKEATESADEEDPIAYFKNVQARIAEEDERARAVMPVGSWSVIRKVTETSLLDGRVEWLSKSLLPKFLDARDNVTLGEMYALFTRVQTLKPLQTAFQAYIQDKVKHIVKDPAQDDEMVPSLLALKAHLTTTLSAAFLRSPPTGRSSASTSTPPEKQRDPAFADALHDGFKLGFRARAKAPAEMIAKHLHALLRKGQGPLSDEEYEGKVDAVLGLYRYSEDKDVFRTFYIRLLAKRLLMSTSASDDFEVGMLKKLKEQYDPEFGIGEKMFKDLHVSRDMMREYHTRRPDDPRAQKLTVSVLEAGAWPFAFSGTQDKGDGRKEKTDRVTDITLPEDMANDLKTFTDFYKTKHTGRKLTFNHALGTAVLKARFNRGTKDLTVSLYQTAVLLLFNRSDKLDFAAIKAQVGETMDDGELRRTLQSLACGRKKVLRKEPVGREVGDDDVFRVNDEFWDERARVHINSIQAKVTDEETKKTNEFVDADRRNYLDAAIVRIMKAKKELTYEQLKTATIDAVKNHFSPSVDMIKKRIEDLVNRDYLQRAAGSVNVFQYVA